MTLAPGVQTCLAAARDGLVWLMLTVVLGSQASRALAQGEPGGEAGGEARDAKDRRRLACGKQADDRHLPAGAEREAFLADCATGGDQDAAQAGS
jgi:hypothetical protein